MDKPLYSPHPGTNRTNRTNSSSSDRKNSSSKKPARTGSQSPGSGSLGGPGPGSRGSPAGTGSGSASSRGSVLGFGVNLQTRRRQLEGVLSKYTNLLQGWQNRYFVLDPEVGQLQYYVSEQGKCQKPRGSLPLIGASVTPSDEAPHMFIVNSVNGELYKLRASDVREQQLWIHQLQACARRHSDSSTKVRKLKGSDEHLSVEKTAGSLELLGSSGRARSSSHLPHLTPSSSPCSQRHLGSVALPSNIVTITHHKSPAAARRVNGRQKPGRLLQVRQVMSQAEDHQKNLVQSIDSLPTKGPLSCLDHDLLLLKATSAATLSCLGECLHLLQQTQSHSQTQNQIQNQSQASPQASQCNHRAPSGAAPAWTVADSPSGGQLKNRGPTLQALAEPSPALRNQSLSPGAE